MSNSAIPHPPSTSGESKPAGHGTPKESMLLFAVIGVLVVALVVAVLIWGLVGLAMWALTLVPVVLILLVVTTFG